MFTRSWERDECLSATFVIEARLYDVTVHLRALSSSTPNNIWTLSANRTLVVKNIRDLFLHGIPGACHASMAADQIVNAARHPGASFALPIIPMRRQGILGHETMYEVLW